MIPESATLLAFGLGFESGPCNIPSLECAFRAQCLCWVLAAFGFFSFMLELLLPSLCLCK